MENLGFVHIYCGDGKGKTTAAMGLALRAAGRGKRVVAAQFLKDGDSGEIAALAGIEQVRVLTGKCIPGFIWEMDAAQKQALAEECTARLAEVEALPADMLVLDEAIDAQNAGILPRGALLGLISRRGEREIVLTGHDPGPDLLAAAEYISEIVKRRHPYDAGVPGRRGIEW